MYASLLTPKGIYEKTALTGSFLKPKVQEYQQLKEKIEALSQEALLVQVKVKDDSIAQV